MALKTDFKDEILQEDKEYRDYDLVSQDGSIIQTNVHLVRKDTPQQVGDNYGSLQINELNTEVNSKLPNTYKPTWNDVANKPTNFPSTWNDVQSKPTTFPSTWNDVQNKPTNFVTGNEIKSFQVITLAQYNALASKDPTVGYLITV